MRTTPKNQICRFLIGLGGGIVLLFLFGFGASPVAHAQEAATPEPNPYYTVNLITLADGTSIDEVIINGPPAPPPGYELERQAVFLPEPNIAAGVNVLPVPAYDWVFGCSAVSGSMIAGYYDRTGFPNMYTGPTDGGVMPLNNSSWPTWSDGGRTWPSNPLTASRNGVDGRITRGSIDDYWIQVDSIASDPYITGGWAEHSYGDAIGDYMRTSQSVYGNPDGGTKFYYWPNSAAQLTCTEMATEGLADGTLGRKFFYEAKGYTVTECYNQNTDNRVSGGFSFAQFKAEIDAGRPVLLNLKGHSVAGVGYDDASSLVYIHDTWDYANHTMTWGSSYSGMQLLSVSIVNIQGGGGVLTPPVVTASDGTDNDRVNLSWTASSGATYYLIYRSDSLSGAKLPPNGLSTPGLSGADNWATPGVTYYYWVKACNASACTDFSAPETGWRGVAVTLVPPVVTASDGTYADKVQVSWTASAGATSYAVFRSESLTGPKTPTNGLITTSLSAADTTATPKVTYYYWVKACVASGCSNFSAAETGWRGVAAALTPPVVTASDGTYANKVQISWTESTGATSYAIYRSESLAGTKIPTNGFVLTGLSAADTWALPDVTYYYWVKACNTSGCSDFSAPEAGWRGSPAGLVPPDVTASDGTYTDKVEVTWTESTGATFYQVYRSTSLAGAKTPVGGIIITGLSFDDLWASPGVIYYYWVKACDDSLCSTFSSVEIGWRGTASGLTPPVVTASNGTDSAKVSVSWTASSGATFYLVYRSDTLSGAKIPANGVLTTGFEVADVWATPGVIYYYWVKACTASACSDFSTPVTGWR